MCSDNCLYYVTCELLLLYHQLETHRGKASNSPLRFGFTCRRPLSSDFDDDAVECFTQATGMIFIYVVVWQVDSSSTVTDRCFNFD